MRRSRSCASWKARFAPVHVDVRRRLGGVGEHDDPIVGDLQEPAAHRVVVLAAALDVGEPARLERRHEGLVVHADAEAARDARRADLVAR